MTFDNEMELKKTALVHPNSKQILRIKCDDEAIFHKMGKKFGCDPKDAPKLLQTAKELNLDVVGVSFHIGSGNNQVNDGKTYRKAIGHAFEVSCGTSKVK